MARHHTSLSWVGTNLSHHAVGIALGDVEEFCGACSLIVGTGGIYHVTEVIELMTCMLLRCPTLIGSPAVGMLRVNGAGGIEIAVGLLSSCHNIKYRVDIRF